MRAFNLAARRGRAGHQEYLIFRSKVPAGGSNAPDRRRHTATTPLQGELQRDAQILSPSA